MNVSFSEEQQLLADTVETLARRVAPTATREVDPSAWAEVWAQLAGAGLIGIRLPDPGGIEAGSVTELMIVVEALARNLCQVPYLGVVLGAELLAMAGAPAALLADIADGSRRLPVALDPTLTTVARYGDAGSVVWDAGGAGGAVMVDDAGALVLVEAAGEPIEGADLTRALIRLPQVPAKLDPKPIGRPLDDVQWTEWNALALGLLAADLLGCMEGTLAAAVEYSKQREQFGVPIGSFQAIQHLCADSHVLTEGVRSATWYGCWSVGRVEAPQALSAARVAKAIASEAMTEVAEAAIQVHGGIAFTWETLPHVYLRRGLLSRRTLGSEAPLFDAIADDRLGATV